MESTRGMQPRISIVLEGRFWGESRSKDPKEPFFFALLGNIQYAARPANEAGCRPHAPACNFAVLKEKRPRAGARSSVPTQLIRSPNGKIQI